MLTAYAASDLADKTTGIADGNYIYMGTWNGAGLKWRVLDADRTNTDATTGMLLITDEALGNGSEYGGVVFNSNGSQDYQGSEAQGWCTNFCNNNLSAGERNAVMAVIKSDGAHTSPAYNIPFKAADNILNGDKVFFLSAQEAETYFTTDSARIANYNDRAGYWWLRSPFAYYAVDAGFVWNDGLVDYHDVNYDVAARPACNINLTSVLFSSAAEGGKSSGAVGAGALVENTPNTCYAWKLTIKDNTHNGFSIGTVTRSGNTLTIDYSGAKNGANEYISAVIKNGDSIKYYGRLASLTSGPASGSVDVNIGGKLGSGDTLYIFNEQCNGDKNTDYASELKEVTVPAPATYTVTFNANGGTCSVSTATTGAGGTLAGLPTATRGGYTFDGWFTAASGGTKITTSTVFNADKTVYAHWTQNSSGGNNDDDSDNESNDSENSSYTPPAPVLASWDYNGHDPSASCYVTTQGPVCRAVFASATPAGYKEAFSFNLLVNKKANYDAKTGKLVINLGDAYVKAGRVFKMIGIDKQGAAHTFNDLDSSDDTVTVNIDGMKGYAFDLIYTDVNVRSTTPSSSGQYYAVKSGDTLGAIAVRLNKTVAYLMQRNDIKDPDKIHIGQRIYY